MCLHNSVFQWKKQHSRTLGFPQHMTLKYKGFESLDFHIKSNVTRKSFIIAKQCSFRYELPKGWVIAPRSLNILFLNQMKVPFHASEQEFKQMLERGTNHPVTWKHFTGLKIRKSHGPPAILHWAFLLQTDGCFWIFLGQEHLHKKMYILMLFA